MHSKCFRRPRGRYLLIPMALAVATGFATAGWAQNETPPSTVNGPTDQTPSTPTIPPSGDPKSGLVKPPDVDSKMSKSVPDIDPKMAKAPPPVVRSQTKPGAETPEQQPPAPKPE